MLSCSYLNALVLARGWPSRWLRGLPSGTSANPIIVKRRALPVSSWSIIASAAEGPGCPERRPQGIENRQIDRTWRPDEHRRPVGLTPVPVRARRNDCKTLAESSAPLS